MSRSARLSRTGAALVAGVLLTAGAAACSSTDDGATVRNVDGTQVSGSGGSGSGSGSASGTAGSTPSGTAASGSGSGLAEEDLSGGEGDAFLLAAVEEYRSYVIEQVDESVATTQEMADAIEAGDLEKAKSLYAPSRQGWERIEPIAGLVEEIDGKVDARVDDFEDENDPAFTGWHRIEYLLWEQGDTAAAAPFADQLLADLAILQGELETLEIPPAALTVGAAELIEEVSTGKITGEEDRYSGTDLWDFAANVEGAEVLIFRISHILEEEDPQLLADIRAGFEEIDAALAAYADGDGYQPYSALTEADKTEMQTILAGLSENLSQVSGALGLE